ncbi:MAG: DUF1573 domain-containing protein [Ignavibacteria bacterium]|nr:DUF1573 domain-containing protein [Ignavibacteria bacterium]MBI3765802.1 DUF1573 domain-containing protein [Ignavibacteriales bacterium]
MRILTTLRRLLLVAWVLPGILSGQPRCSIVGGLAFDFGEVMAGSSTKKLLTIKNAGSDTLIVSNVSASCGCTGTLLSNDHIAPSDTGILSIIFNARQFKGVVHKQVTFNTNDTTQKSVEISFTANVLHVLGVDPDYLFIRTMADSTASASVSLTNLSEGPIKIRSVSSTSNAIAAKLSKDELKPGEEVELTGVFTPPSAGTFNGNIELTTDHPKMPHLSIRFFAWVKDKRTASTIQHN